MPRNNRAATSARKPARRRAGRREEGLLVAFTALLRADRWLFDATQAVMGAGLSTESDALRDIRFRIARCLDLLQPQAYEALEARRRN